MKKVFVIGFAIYSQILAQNPLPDQDSCDNQGECYKSHVVDTLVTPTLEDCKNNCEQNQNCEYFTWFADNNGCLLFADCTFNSTACTDCYTGAADCALYTCSEPGTCQNATFLDFALANDANDCLNFCKNNPECKWFSFDPEQSNACTLTSDCPTIDNSCAGCVHGQVECNVHSNFNIMVATGLDVNGDTTDSVEVVMMDSITTCPNLVANYPISLHLAVTMQHNSQLVLCGGKDGDYIPQADCYSFSNDAWNIEGFKLEPARYGAISVETRPGEWLVMGGRDDSSHDLLDSQALKNGIFTRGVDLPMPNYAGSAVMLNETHAFMAIGYGGSENSPNNYLLNINTDEWTRIADRTLSYFRYHSSGTFYNSTAGEIQVANIGRYGIEVYSPNSDSWHSGIASPISGLEASAAIQAGPDSFFLIAGYSEGSRTGHVYKFDENGLTIVKQDILSIPRNTHVAMAIAKEDFTCS